MTNDELLELLSFEADLDAVEIVSETEMQYDATLIVAKLTYQDETLTVPFIHYPGRDWLFTPCDWQGNNPLTAEGVESINWRVNNTDSEGVIFEGVPMLAPWTAEPAIIHKSVRMSIGAQIRAARESRKITLRALADICGVRASHISHIEQGRYNCTIDILAQIAKALNVEFRID